MKMKKILRSALAILCSASLVLGSFGMIIPTVRAAESLPTGFTEVTPADFGIADFSGNTDKVSHTSSLKPLQSADKMLFQTKVVFGSGTLSLLDKDVSTSAIEGINFWKSGNDAIRFNCSYAKIHVGGYYEGGTYKDGQIGFNAAGTEPYIYNMYPTLPTGTTTATAEFSMAITTEVVNFNEGTTANDLKLGVWFDGKLYNDTYFYLCDYIFTEDNILMTATVESITSPSVQKPNTLPTDYNEVTPSEFGIADFSGNTEMVSYTSSLKPLQSADKMLFQTKVIFGSGILSLFDKDVSTEAIEGIRFWKNGDSAIRFNCSYTKIHVGGYYEDGVYTGGQLGLTADGTNPYIYDMYPTLPEGTTSATAEFSLAITTEVVNFNEGTTANDLKLGVWFDGKLYNDTYFYLCDYIFTEDNILMTATVESITSPSVEVPYSDLTPAMMGVLDTTDANGVTIKTPTEAEKLYNLDKTKFSANVHFQSDRLSYFTYLFNEAGRGQLAFMVNQHSSRLMIYNYKNTGDTTLYFGDKIADGVDIDTAYEKLANDESNCGYMLGSAAGYSFIGANASFSITTEFVDFDGDGNKDDLEIGIFVGGHEDKPKYGYYKDYEETTFKGVVSTYQVQAISSPEVQNPAQPIQPSTPPVPTVYADLTPAMLGVPDTTDANGVTIKTPTEAEKLYNLDKTKFSANVHFQSDRLSYFTYLFNEAGHGQLAFMVNQHSSRLMIYNYKNTGDTTLYFGDKIADGVDIDTAYEKLANDESNCGLMLGSAAGYNFIGANASFSITTEFVDFDGDGNKDDLEIGIFVGGHEDKPKYCYYKDYEETTFKGIVSTYQVQAISSSTVENPATPVQPSTPPGPTNPDEDEPKEEILPTGFTEVAPNFFDIDDFKDNVEDPITYQDTKSPFTSAHEVMLYADVIFGNGRTIEYLYNGATQSGIMLWAKENLHVRNYMSPSDSAGMYIGGEFVNGEYKGGNLISGRHDNYVIKASAFSDTENFDTLKVSLILTTEFVDFDGEGTANDLKLGVWINNKLYDNTYIYMRNCLDTYTPALKMNVVEMSSPISTGSGEKEDTVPAMPEITFTDFGVNDGVYGYNKKNPMDFAISGSYKDGFANQTFVGTVNFTDKPATCIGFAGQTSAWQGIRITSRGDGNLSFVDANGQFPTVVIYEKLAKLEKTTLTDRDVKIGLTFEVTDLDNDGKKDDVRFWLTLDGVLYRNKPIVKAMDYEQYLGNMIGIYSDHEESNVKVASKDLNRPNNDETLPTDFTKVAPNFFDIDDFKDNVEDPVTYQSTQAPFTSADKVMLYADVVFGNGRTIEYLYNAATGSGIMLWAKENLHVRNYMSPSESAGMYIGGEFVNGEYKGGTLISGRHDNYVIKASAFSSTENFDTLKVSLILTTEFVDFDGEGTANDLKLGVWINGKLYDNTYIYMRNCLDTYTTVLKMNVVEMSSPISTGSGQKEDKVPVLPEITFSDFDIEDGTYGYNKENPKDFAITGSYREGFANQTFVGTVNFTDEPATCIGFAGKTSAWQGIRITSRGDGNLSLVDANGQFPTVVIYAKLAKTTLTERDMEIGLTFEVTDLDGDGEKDDVRFWLTLDGVLYRNKPIVKAIDYAQYLGKFIGIYSDHEKSSVTIASKDIQRPVQEVDFSIMGFTKDWEKTLAAGSKSMTNGVVGNKAPYTADNTNSTNYIAICILAFVMLGGVFYSKGYGKKETD